MDVVALQAAKVDAATKFRRIPGPGEVWGLGDSITANDYTAPTSTAGPIFRPRVWLMHACLRSKGKLRFGGIAATGGYTTAQVLATHLPTVLAARPAFCVVHAGTNDPGTLTLAQTIANLTSIYTQLLAAGITPVATTMLPKQTLLNSSGASLHRMTLWISRYAASHGFPCVDWNSLFVDPSNGGWSGYNAAGGTYNTDDTHPNAAAAALMGQAIVDALTPRLPLGLSFLPTSNVQAASNYLPTNVNALFYTDTNSDGYPDGFSTSVVTGATYSITAVPAGEGLGNYFNVTKGGAGNPFPQAAFGAAIIPGNRMAVCCLIKATVKAGGGKLQLRFTDSSTVDLVALRDWTEDVPAGSVFYLEFSVASGTGLANPKFVPALDTGNGTVSVGQVGIYDLTAQGVL